MRAQRWMAWLAGLSMVFVLAACQTEKPLPEQRFYLRGKVVAVNKSQGTVTLAHEAIPGYMAAMTMDYPLKDKWAFDILKPGQTVTATLVVASDRAWLEGVVITEEAKPESNSLAPPESAHTPLGEIVPDFALINQDGKRIHLHQYHGKVLLLTFIYTRCPLPDYCPLMSKNFAQIMEQVRSDPKLSPSTHLLSISIDPKYDTPEVLFKYGLAYLSDDPKGFAHWQFTAPSPENLKKLASAFSLAYTEEDNQISHTMSTVLVGPDAKLAKIWDTSDWTIAEVLSTMRQVENAGH